MSVAGTRAEPVMSGMPRCPFDHRVVVVPSTPATAAGVVALGVTALGLPAPQLASSAMAAASAAVHSGMPRRTARGVPLCRHMLAPLLALGRGRGTLAPEASIVPDP